MNEFETAIRTTAERRHADEWSLVLSSQGIEHAVRAQPGGIAILVDPTNAESALRALDAYELENPKTSDPSADPADPVRELDRFVGGAVAALLVAFFVTTGPRNPEVIWFAEGSADSARILAGELWRTVTSLCLHADLAHVLSNALFGALFVSAVCAGFGPGVGLALVLAAGASGNLANTIFQGPGHVSVGASTAVFGAVGLLAGRAMARRIRRGEAGLRLWVPIAAGLALLAMLGTGERSDVWAHAFGFASGGFLGVPASLAWPKHANPGLQSLAFALALALLVGCWRLGLA